MADYHNRATPPAPEVTWVTTQGGGHLQVRNIVAFMQVAEGRVSIETASGASIISTDPAFFAQPAQEGAAKS